MLNTFNGDVEKAEIFLKEVVKTSPKYALDYALILSIQGKVTESDEIIKQILKDNPNDNRAAFNRGWHLLREGKLKEGFQHLDRGRSENVFGSPALEGAEWKGESLANKRILLRGEGGLGDEIINVRFAKQLHELGAKVTVSCHPSLGLVFARLPFIDSLVMRNYEAVSYFDYWTPAMSVAGKVCNSFDELESGAYLTAAPTHIHKFKQIINSSKLKVGIRWAGNNQFEHEQFRKFPTELMLSLQDIPHIQLYSLQRDADLVTLPESIIDLGSFIDTWEDTAGAIANLDLVITSCTSIAHMAAALGKPTWVIVPVLPYYIWAEEGNKSSWYDSVTLFRQEKFGEWSEPFNKIRKELECYQS